MSMDRFGPDPARMPHPHIATLAFDDLAARRIECALLAGALAVGTRWRGAGEPQADDPEPDVLVILMGRGVTERDQLMRRLRRRMPSSHLVAVMPDDSRRGIRRADDRGAGLGQCTGI
jgi:hypothetical protein